jgi:riboflavin synthase
MRPMFTGLVECAGEVVELVERDEAWRLSVAVPGFAGELSLGESVAVNGCCLTVVSVEGDHVGFDLLEQTLRCTSLGGAAAGQPVNLERSVAVGARMGGHFVSGHIDTRGIIECFEQKGKNFFLKIVPQPLDGLRYVVEKGSIAVDGISLTVAGVDDEAFWLWIIPHTLAATNLRVRRVGDAVNLEFDLLAKYVEKLCGGSSAAATELQITNQ